jgi:hypothetical protein
MLQKINEVFHLKPEKSNGHFYAIKLCILALLANIYQNEICLERKLWNIMNHILYMHYIYRNIYRFEMIKVKDRCLFTSERICGTDQNENSLSRETGESCDCI